MSDDTSAVPLDDLDRFAERFVGYHCPTCGREIPKSAYDALMERMRAGKPAECDYCPY